MDVMLVFEIITPGRIYWGTCSRPTFIDQQVACGHPSLLLIDTLLCGLCAWSWHRSFLKWQTWSAACIFPTRCLCYSWRVTKRTGLPNRCRKTVWPVQSQGVAGNKQKHCSVARRPVNANKASHLQQSTTTLHRRCYGLNTHEHYNNG